MECPGYWPTGFQRRPAARPWSYRSRMSPCPLPSSHVVVRHRSTRTQSQRWRGLALYPSPRAPVWLRAGAVAPPGSVARVLDPGRPPAARSALTQVIPGYGCALRSTCGNPLLAARVAVAVLEDCGHAVRGVWLASRGRCASVTALHRKAAGMTTVPNRRQMAGVSGATSGGHCPEGATPIRTATSTRRAGSPHGR
jgi:hypothetical protein